MTRLSRPLAQLCDLFDLMMAMQLQKLRKQYPRDAEGQLKKRLDAWLLEEDPLDPAEFERVSWPRRRPGSAKKTRKTKLRLRR